MMGAVKTAAHDDMELARALEEFGCPYAVGDTRARAWCEGYEAGLESAQESMRNLAPAIARIAQ